MDSENKSRVSGDDVCEMMAGVTNDWAVRYWDGWQSIHVAAMKGNTEIVKRLIVSGADVLKKDDYGETPFMIATRRHNPETAAVIEKKQVEELAKIEAEKAARKSRASKAAA